MLIQCALSQRKVVLEQTQWNISLEFSLIKYDNSETLWYHFLWVKIGSRLYYDIVSNKEWHKLKSSDNNS